MLAQQYKPTKADFFAICQHSADAKNKRLEFSHGEIIEVSPTGNLHSNIQEVLSDWFKSIVDNRLLVKITATIDGPNMTRDPDLVVLNQVSQGQYVAPEEVELVVEVGDTTFNEDMKLYRGSKLADFAEAGIPRVIVISAQGQQAFEFTQPSGNRYLEQVEITEITYQEFSLPLVTLFAAVTK